MSFHTLYPLPSYVYRFPITNIPLQSGSFVTIYKPTLTHHNYSKSMVQLDSLLAFYLLWVWTSVRSHMFIIMVSYRFPQRPVLHLFISLHFQSMILYFLCSVAFFRMPCAWKHTVLPLRTGFLHLAVCISHSSRSFHGLKAHFLYSLNDIPLPG